MMTGESRLAISSISVRPIIRLPVLPSGVRANIAARSEPSYRTPLQSILRRRRVRFESWSNKGGSRHSRMLAAYYPWPAIKLVRYHRRRRRGSLAPPRKPRYPSPWFARQPVLASWSGALLFQFRVAGFRGGRCSTAPRWRPGAPRWQGSSRTFNKPSPRSTWPLTGQARSRPISGTGRGGRTPDPRQRATQGPAHPSGSPDPAEPKGHAPGRPRLPSRHLVSGAPWARPRGMLFSLTTSLLVDSRLLATFR